METDVDILQRMLRAIYGNPDDAYCNRVLACIEAAIATAQTFDQAAQAVARVLNAEIDSGDLSDDEDLFKRICEAASVMLDRFEHKISHDAGEWRRRV